MVVNQVLAMSACKTELRQLCVSCGLLRWKESLLYVLSAAIRFSVWVYDHVKLAGIPL